MKKILRALIVVMVVVMGLSVFAACTPKEDKLKEKYEAAGYVVISGKPSTYGLDESEADYILIATKLTSTAVVICFKESADAKAYYKEQKADAEKGTLRISGKAVISGNAEAVKIA